MGLDEGVVMFFSILLGYLFTLFEVSSSLYDFTKPVTFFFDELELVRKAGEWNEDDRMNYMILELHRKIPERMATEVAKFPSETATNFFLLDSSSFSE